MDENSRDLFWGTIPKLTKIMTNMRVGFASGPLHIIQPKRLAFVSVGVNSFIVLLTVEWVRH
jgi:hypothetical protein